MGKITFRADDDLVDELEAFDASKSEVMRDALRTYLDEHVGEAASSGAGTSESGADVGSREPAATDRRGTIDDLVRERVDEVLERRLSGRPRGESQDVNVTVSLEGAEERTRRTASTGQPSDAHDKGRETPEMHGQPTERSEPRLEGPDSAPGATDERGGRSCGRCGETIEGDHVYCPNCGEKASKRVFCECGDEVRSDWSFCPGCGRRTPAADVLDSR